LLLGDHPVEADLVWVMLEDHGWAAFVIDEVDGSGDAGVLHALEHGKLSSRRP